MKAKQVINARRIRSVKFTFFFCRDISGNIFLDKEEIKGKSFIKLKINREIYSNDNEIILDFNQKYKKFIQEMGDDNSWEDISFNEL